MMVSASVCAVYPCECCLSVCRYICVCSRERACMRLGPAFMTDES